jgi:RNA recognition motif-containing protein
MPAARSCLHTASHVAASALIMRCLQIFLGGLPYHFSEEQCRQLLEPFGELQSFELVRDREKGESKGYGFAVFADKAVTETAIVGLNGLSIDGRVLTCRKCASCHALPSHGSRF